MKLHNKFILALSICVLSVSQVYSAENRALESDSVFSDLEKLIAPLQEIDIKDTALFGLMNQSGCDSNEKSIIRLLVQYERVFSKAKSAYGQEKEILSLKIQECVNHLSQQVFEDIDSAYLEKINQIQSWSENQKDEDSSSFLKEQLQSRWEVLYLDDFLQSAALRQKRVNTQGNIGLLTGTIYGSVLLASAAKNPATFASRAQMFKNVFLAPGVGYAGPTLLGRSSGELTHALMSPKGKPIPPAPAMYFYKGFEDLDYYSLQSLKAHTRQMNAALISAAAGWAVFVTGTTRVALALSEATRVGAAGATVLSAGTVAPATVTLIAVSVAFDYVVNETVHQISYHSALSKLRENIIIAKDRFLETLRLYRRGEGSFDALMNASAALSMSVRMYEGFFAYPIEEKRIDFLLKLKKIEDQKNKTLQKAGTRYGIGSKVYRNLKQKEESKLQDESIKLSQKFQKETRDLRASFYGNGDSTVANDVAIDFLIASELNPHNREELNNQIQQAEGFEIDMKRKVFSNIREYLSQNTSASFKAFLQEKRLAIAQHSARELRTATSDTLTYRIDRLLLESISLLRQSNNSRIESEVIRPLTYSLKEYTVFGAMSLSSQEAK